MEKTLFINTRDEMINVGEQIGKNCFPNILITLNGDLGAGKTTFTKGIAKGLGIEAIVSSPTFTIMKIYYGRLTLFHMDVYRIDNPLNDFELEEYFESDGVCVVEWADIISCLLPDKRLDIEIIDLGDDKRKFIMKTNDDNLDIINIIESVKTC